MNESTSEPLSEHEIHPTQDVDDTETNIYEQIKSKLGNLDRKTFEYELNKIYKEDESGLNEIRCSLYDFAKASKGNFPDGCLIKRVNRVSGISIVQKYASDIYCLFSYIEGTIDASALQGLVMSKSKSNSRISQYIGDVTLDPADTTCDQNSNISVLETETLREEDVAPLVLILSNIQELKQVVQESNSDIHSKLEATEAKYDKEISELKALCKQKSTQIERLENIVEDMRDREGKLKSEVKLLKQQDKTNTTYLEQTKKLLGGTAASLQSKLNSLESKMSAMNSKLQDIQRGSSPVVSPRGRDIQLEGPSSATVIQTTNQSKINQPQQTYAEKATSKPHTKTATACQDSVILISPSSNATSVQKPSCDKFNGSMKIPAIITQDRRDSFTGIVRPSIKRAALSNVYLDRSVEDMTNSIYNYAENKGVHLTFVRHISTRETRYGETATFRLNVQAEDHVTIQQEGFWPDKVKCKDWFSPSQRDAFKQDRNNTRSKVRYDQSSANISERHDSKQNSYYPSKDGDGYRSHVTNRYYHHDSFKDLSSNNRFDVLDY